FGMGQIQRLYEPLAEWQMQRLPQREEGYTLDLDATVFERYGQQEGSLKGHNPRQHGRPSHHPLLAVLNEAHFLLHGRLRSGNCGTSRGVEEFLKEALALWGQREKIRLLRADSGFFDDKLLSFLQQRLLPYIVVARLTPWVKRAAQRGEQWTMLDDDYAVGRVPAPTARLECGAAIRGDSRASARGSRQRRPQADRCARVYLSRLRRQWRRPSRADLAGLQSGGRHGEPHRRVEARSGRRWLLHETVFRHRGRLSRRVTTVQLTGRVPARGWPACLSRARHH